MTQRDATPSFGAFSSVRSDLELHRAQVTAAEIKRAWRHGAHADAAAAFEGHPELRAFRSLAIDLAHNEYRHRLETGENVKTDDFCRRFPALEQSLYLLIHVDSLLESDPELQSLQQQIPWPKPGDTFLGYRVAAELGRGTFGRVFLAREPALGNRQVALKVALRGADEANVLGKLRHPNIVPVYSVHWDDATGLAAFCMPYVGRATLQDVLERMVAGGEPPMRADAILDAIRSANEGVEDVDNRVSSWPDAVGTTVRILRAGSYVDGAIYLAARLADALAHSHRCGICHRDLKPSNVLLSPDGQPLLLDFNLSVDDARSPFRIGGTLPYMAPEVVAAVLNHNHGAGERPYDPRSDVFSLGVILYEALTGSQPFGEIARDVALEESARRLRDQQAVGPMPVPKKNRRVDDRLAGLVHRCLAFDPDDRPQSAGELAEGLRSELAFHRRARRWGRDHRRRVSVAAIVLLLLVATGIGYLVTRPPYSRRQFQLAIACCEQEDYGVAIEHFDNSLRADPGQSEVLLARSRALVQQRDFSAAAVDFRAARALAEEPTTDACLAYCYAKLNEHQAAIYYGEQALDRGLASSSVLNNIGFSYRRLNRSDQAEKYLQRAIAADERLVAAHLNLLVVYVNRALGGRVVTDSAAVQAEKTAAIAPPSADVYHQAGILLACAARKRPELIQPAIAYLEKAVARGLDPASLGNRPSFSALRAEAAFQALLKRPPGRKPSVKPVYLVSPF